MAVDFLSSDIVFPSDSNEPKLSADPCTKMPESVDWAVYDYYSTALEKQCTPLHSLTDLCRLEPVKDEKPLWKYPPLFALQDKQDDQAVILVLSSTLKTANYSPPIIQPPSQKQDLRAALRGALEIVENDMQRNNAYDHFPSRNPATATPTTTTKQTAATHAWSWKDEFVQRATNKLHHWDKEDFDLDGDYPVPSPAYSLISNNPVLLESSTTSPLSSCLQDHPIKPRSSPPLQASQALQLERSGPSVEPVTESKHKEEPTCYEPTSVTEKPSMTHMKPWKLLVQKLKKSFKKHHQHNNNNNKSESSNRFRRFFQRQPPKLDA
ncbi:uncharacterized protein BYT42DRAFT_614350 [Radiomyces spectabilis]|uniref:uncharacterized protein n=1 Tax=Radiomyces spectabilis TaxID=64574 RepID=UPI00221FA1AE|nr:uncharacterized protein BYT42DRAFT_614350 [Radiomyces spectabilis]KAI8377688.1 hypothetical protein BYT42DRAFT_614350 [Radiomyces spectabilis]